MIRHNLVPALAALLLAAGVAPALAATASGQQALVDRATLAVQDLVNPETGQDAASVLRLARAVVICPNVMRAGFLLGGEGGGCVLLARDAAGSWSAPAFYTMGGASIGFQVGLQDAEIMMMIRTPRGLQAIIDDQVKLGAGASVALVNLGGGVEAATGAAMSADIIAFAKTRGLFAGVSIQGSVLGADSAGNAVYYGQPVGPQDVVLQMRVNNPGADPLRSALMQLGGPGPAPPAPVTAYATPAPSYAPPAYAAPAYAQPTYAQPTYAQPTYAQPTYAPPAGAPLAYAPRSLSPGSVQQQTLPPPGR